MFVYKVLRASISNGFNKDTVTFAFCLTHASVTKKSPYEHNILPKKGPTIVLCQNVSKGMLLSAGRATGKGVGVKEKNKQTKSTLACENIRFSSLFPAGDVSRETSPPSTSRFDVFADS